MSDNNLIRRLKIARADLRSIFGKSKHRKCLYYFYFKILRKILLFCFLGISLIYLSFQADLPHDSINRDTLRQVEIVSYFYCVADLGVLLACIGIIRCSLQGVLFSIFVMTLHTTLAIIRILTPKGTTPSIAVYRVVGILRTLSFLAELSVLDEKLPLVLCKLHKPISDLDAKMVGKKDVNDQLHSIPISKQIEIRTNLLKSPKRNSVEYREAVLLEGFNKCIKSSFNPTESQVELMRGGSNKSLTAQLQKLLDPDFNVFEFDASCFKKSLYVLMNYYYNFYDFKSLNIPELKYNNLVYNIQNNYNPNPYHNHLHGSDVTNSVFAILEYFEAKHLFQPFEILVLLMSASMHDLDHPGNNNLFEINTSSTLSLAYNDKSVLENYHLFVFFNLISYSSLNIFECVSNLELKDIRKQFITNVIATDLMNHKSDLGKFQGIVAEAKDNQSILAQNDSKNIIMSQIIHFADISNPSKPFYLYKQWVDMLFDEFFAQGDREKELNLPVSMLCDRDTTKVPNSQIFFMNFFVRDVLSTFSGLLPKFEEAKDQMECNIKEWERLKEEEQL